MVLYVSISLLINLGQQIITASRQYQVKVEQITLIKKFESDEKKKITNYENSDISYAALEAKITVY